MSAMRLRLKHFMLYVTLLLAGLVLGGESLFAQVPVARPGYVVKIVAAGDRARFCSTPACQTGSGKL